jgi:hypothetical protein
MQQPPLQELLHHLRGTPGQQQRRRHHQFRLVLELLCRSPTLHAAA